MLNSMVTFLNSVWTENTFYGQFRSTKLKMSVSYESWSLAEFQYAEFDGDVHFFCFGLKVACFGIFGPKTQNYLFKMTPRA